MTNRLLPRGRAALVLLLLLGLAVAAERGRWFTRLLASGTPERTWIWAAASPREVKARAFFLARDFELAAVPPAARLEVMADPEYLVRLNGRRIGSAEYRPDSPIDVYDARSALRVGRNRLLLELRSATGSGGATLRLTDGDGHELLASDAKWRVYGGIWRALSDLDSPPPTGSPSAVLGVAPFGRWSLPALRARPTYLETVANDAVAPARAWRPAGDGNWRRLAARKRRAERLAAGEVTEIDFGEEIAGYLHLDLEPQPTVEGMLFFATTAGESLDRAPDSVVVAVPNLNFWQDVAPRRFRYLTLVGLPSVRRVAVVPLRADAAAGLGPPPPVPGLFGQPAEPARVPLVEELRRRLLSGAPAPR